jgi:hypothetical protein
MIVIHELLLDRVLPRTLDLKLAMRLDAPR